MSETATLRPGDPPPFWEGLWHPEGKAEGAIMVKPLGAGEVRAAAAAPAEPVIAMPAPPPPALQMPPPAPPEPALQMPPPAPPEPAIQMPPPEPALQMPPPAPPEPAIAMPAAPPPAPAIAMPAAPPPPPPAPAAPPSGGTGPLGAPRSFVLTLANQAPLTPATGIPPALDAAAAEALRAKAKELQAANQLGPAMQALSEALRRTPGDPAVYAQLGQTLMAGRAWEDAAHHFLVSYMLAPREPAYGRMTLHAAWALGYVGWAFQIAQSLYKVQPAPELAEIGRQAQAWLAGKPAGAVTSLCPACRTNAVLPGAGPCPKCGAASMLAPANAVGFAGLKLLQQGPGGRLFAGAGCASCTQDTVLVLAKGGPRCQACQAPALAPI